MTPDHIRRLRAQLGLTQPKFVAVMHEANPLGQVNVPLLSRWESGTSGRTVTPNPYNVAALTRVWLADGYPCTANGQPATLTTNSPASSYGLPVVVIDGVPYGSAEIATLDLGDAPETIRDAAVRAGYRG